MRIAAALRVEVGELLAAPEEPGPGTVVRGEASPFYEGEGFRFQPLIPEAGPEGLAAVKIVFPTGRSRSTRSTRARSGSTFSPGGCG